MTAYTFDLLYLGNLTVADVNETDFGNDDNSMFLGVFDSSDLAISPVTFNDDNDDTFILDDEAGQTETVEYNFTGPSGPASYNGLIDSTVEVTVRVTHADGSTTDFTTILLQMTNGDTFLTDTDGSLDNTTIQSVEITSIVNDDYAGVALGAYMGADNSSVVCFVEGTWIETDTGPKPIETLGPGQMVRTLDRGLQPVRWLGHRVVHHPGPHSPVVIEAGALAPGSPAEDVHISPQHRVLAGNKVCARMFGTNEILVQAKALIGAPGIRQADGMAKVTYWHMAFNRHEIVVANGAFLESLYAGPEALATLSAFQSLSLRAALGPALRRQLCRSCPSLRQQRQWLMRSLRNEHPLSRAPAPAERV